MTDAAGLPDDPVAIGVIRRAVGLEGRCVVTAFGRTLESLAGPCDVVVGRESEPGRKVVLLEVRRDARGCICRFEGVDSREAADGLRGTMVLVERSRLSGLSGNEYYHFELQGMVVATTGGEEIGRVDEVLKLPTIDAIEVGRPGKPAVTIPLEDAVVTAIDRVSRRIVVDAGAVEELL